ncbi:hypothetical protein BC936DRAFT_138641 [Jimgerdemannia flammicorona]|uniref:PNPLA domain-containing protein n=1 Tax=Jimgerdemannia flammicorona TaxID=994334 RepID=A0A433DI84_9FUNG|nr:hypothetical protein BC936DRAFT_138641 [Jimgerdemannia flammicorona]
MAYSNAILAYPMEAYAKTKRILNISVSSTRKFEVPQLLNYLTAPNVLIWSAACASTALMGLYDTVNLLAKDKYGAIVSWSPSIVLNTAHRQSVDFYPIMTYLTVIAS